MTHAPYSASEHIIHPLVFLRLGCNTHVDLAQSDGQMAVDSANRPLDQWGMLMADSSGREAADNRKGFVSTAATAGRVVLAFLSIMLALPGISLSLSPYTMPIALGLALVSMILSRIAKSGNAGGGIKFMATAGFVLSCVALVSAAVWAMLYSNATM